MRVDLILPRMTDSAGKLYAPSIFSKLARPFLGLGEMGTSPPLSLMMLAAVTPPGVELRLVDERVEDIDFDEPVDLVGISAVTRSIDRAYEIAAEYRRRGTKVVLGGVHPSSLPHEAARHADAVVVGEGELVWPRILEDCRQGALQQIYQGGRDTDVSSLPAPRHDLLPHPEKYGVSKVVAASRGCPNGCSFCSCGIAVGRRYRHRRVEDVVDELRSLPGKVAFFADDNLGWDLEFTKALVRGIAPLGLRWFGELSAQALEDEELVDLLAGSGCAVMALGFESLSPKVLRSVGKWRTNDPARYPEIVKRLHRQRICVVGFFMVGFDDDDPDVFDRIGDFVDENCVEMPGIQTLIPYPGTRLYSQLEKEGRILHRDWRHYGTLAGDVVYQLKCMTPQQLADGYQALARRVHSVPATLRRLVGAGTLLTTGALPAIHVNAQSAQSIRADTSMMARQRSAAEPQTATDPRLPARAA